MSAFEDACDDMIRLTALVLSLDPYKELAHCIRVQAELHAGMDDMAAHAERKHKEQATWAKKCKSS